jgi:WD40 repeat protein/DNA-binding XRE family transcriptional regulator
LIEQETSFGRWLKQRRKELDLTQFDLAERVGCSEDTIQKIEVGERRPSRQVAQLLAQQLEIPPEEWPAFVRGARAANEGGAGGGATEVRPGLAVPSVPVPSHPSNGSTLPPASIELSESVVVANPYKGLRAFHEADAPDFFGREALTQRLRERLSEETQMSRFLAVVGPSGSGKSSVVRAGLVPALRHEALPGGLSPVMVDLTPGTQPLEELEAALLRVAVNPPSSLMEQLRADERGLARAVKRVLPGDERTELVLVIDQFEELFTLVPDEGVRADFIDSLFSAVTDPRSRLWVVITLRADFYDRPLLYLPSSELMGQRTEVVGPLSSDELYKAITGPAERAGLELESGLAATIMQDVGEQSGMLPLVQYALTELYERREGRLLTLTAYRASGGVFGSLASRAESLYGSLTAAEQAEARQLFLRLVTLGEGMEDTRRRVLMPEVLSAAENEQALHRVVDLFGRYRMLTFDRDPLTGGPTVEVAHEALLRTWGRLREWLDASREALRVQRRLMTAVYDWETAGRESSFLARGARLEQFEAVALSGDLALTAEEQEFIANSLEEKERQELTERERLARELTLQKRAASRTRYLAGALAIFLLVALGLTLFALQKQTEADVQRKQAEVNLTSSEALRLAAEANTLLQTGGPTELTALLAIRSMQAQHSTQGDQVLEAVSLLEYPLQHYIGHTSQVNGVAFSPDGKFVLSAGLSDDTARLWDTQTGKELRQFLGHTNAVQAVAYSPDGRTVLTSSGDKTARLWDAQTGDELRQFLGHTDRVGTVAFSPDGKFVLTGSYDKTARLWDAQTGEELRQFLGHSGSIWAAAYSPDGNYVLTGSTDNEARLWDAQTGEPVHTFTGHANLVYRVAFSRDSKYVLTGSFDNTALLWDVETGQIVRHFTGLSGGTSAVAYSPDGKYALTGTGDGSIFLWDLQAPTGLPIFTGHSEEVLSVGYSLDGKYVLTGGVTGDKTGIARLWDAQSGKELRQFLGHTDVVSIVKFSPDGKYVLTGGETDGTIRLWDIQSAKLLHTTPYTGNLYALSYSPDGKIMVVGGEGGAELRDPQTGESIRKFVGHTDTVLAAAYSPDGKSVLTGSADKTARLWDAQTGKELRQFLGHSDALKAVAYSPDGKYVLTSSLDKTARLWDTETGKEVRIFTGHTDIVHSVAFSPDGEYVLTSSLDGTARLWATATGEEVRRFTGHSGPVNGAVFSPDGKLVLTGSNDGTARVWNVDYHDTIRYLCSRLKRDLTDSERTQYGITDKGPTCANP